MLKIPRQQVLDRWDSLTDNLREALCSEQNADILWHVCQSQHLSEDKIGIVAILAGDVIMGFAHPEDLAKEIKNELNLNPAIAETIAAEINRKIFIPIKSELEKVYSPVTAENIAAKPTEAAQSVPSSEEVLDLRKYKELPKPPQVQPASEIVKTPVASYVESLRIEPPVPIAVVPSSTSKVNPLTQFGAGRVEPPKFTAANKPFDVARDKPEAGRFETPKIIPIGEKEKEIAELPPLSKLPSEEPLIIHKEVQLRPLPETKKSLGGFFSFLKREKKEIKQASVMAKIDIGGKPKEPPVVSRTEPPKVRVVHYSEFLTPVTQPGEVKVEKKEIVEKKEPMPIVPKPPVVSRIEPPENLPVANQIKAPVASRFEPPVVSRVEPLRPQISKPEIPKPEIPKVKTSVESVLDLRKIAELKKPAVEEPLVKPPVASPLTTQQIHDRLEQSRKITSPGISRVEIKPPVASPSSAFRVSRAESPKAEPPKIEPQVVKHIEPLVVSPPTPLKPNRVEPPVISPSAALRTSHVEPPKPSPIKPVVKPVGPDGEMIDLRSFK